MIQLTLKPAVALHWLVAVACLGTAAVAIPAHAASGNKPVILPWGGEGEALEYHSCGTGEGCWIAEVKNTHGKVKAKLRCDGKSLYSSVTPSPSTAASAPPVNTTWPQPEQPYANNCSSLNDSPDKPAAIRKALEKLLKRGDGKGK